ncbi:MAG: HlyD family secretion protein [Fimbriimonadaceae bacterium]
MNLKFVGGAIAVIVLAAGGYLIDRSRAANEAQLSGFFEIQPTEVSSRLGGRVAQILVKEGDAVKRGQALVRLEAATNEASLRAQRFAARQAAEQYLETERGTRLEDIQKQQSVVRELQASLDRLVNGPLPEEISSAREHLAQLRAVYRKMVAGSRPEEIASAKAAAAVAFEKFRQAERGLTPEERAELKAQLDGAIAAESLAKQNVDRDGPLSREGAIPMRDFDTSRSTYQQAVARRKAAQEAYRRAMEGTPAEELAQARQAYLQAQAQFDLVVRGNRPEDIDAARQDMLQAAEALRIAVKGSRPEDIRGARALLAEAQTQLLELKRGNRPEEIAKAKAAAEQAAAQTQSLRETVNERVAYAPTDGVVDHVLVGQGDLVAPGSPIVQMSNPSDIWVRVYIPESDLSKVSVGDRADFKFDGIAETIAGKVESIATKGEFTPGNLQSPEQRALQVFAVRLRLAQPDSRIKAGMYVTVTRVGQWP